MALPHSPCRRWRGALRFPNGGSCLSPWRRCVMLRVSQRVPLCVPPPRPICLCPARPQSCPCLCHRARVAVLRCVRLRWFVLRAFQRTFREGSGRCGRLLQRVARHFAKAGSAAKRESTAAKREPSAAKRAAHGSAKRSGDRSPHSDRYAARLRLGAYSPLFEVRRGHRPRPTGSGGAADRAARWLARLVNAHH